MVVRTPERVDPPGTTYRPRRGMEQFHHPRPVCIGHGGDSRPTPQRERLMAGLTGRVLEIGAGDGVKLTCYPADVEEIVLVDPDPFLRAAARLASAGVSAPVRIVDGFPARLPVPDASCDAVVCSLILCCVPQVEATLSEVTRVLCTGGELRFYEHQRSEDPMITLTQSLAAPMWSRVFGGCHPARDTVASIKGSGFAIERLDRFSFHHVNHVLGVARPR
jgi:ubiquinone/menaquinone biosynthesis C-methylase UbiE